MEVCGGQTHTIVKYGLDRVLPPERRTGPRPRLSGVRHVAGDDRPRPRHRLAAGRHLLLVRRHAARARLARRSAAAQVAGQRRARRLLAARRRQPGGGQPDRQVVFFAIGFETTAPPNAMAVWLARKRRLTNFSVLVSHVLVPPAMTRHPGKRRTIACRDSSARATSAPSWAAREYEPIARRYRVPIVITGFEPLDLLEGVLAHGAAARSGPGRGREPVRPRRAAGGQSARRGS